ncbi:LLM class flavin-dependent oxidoreductase [Kribbella antibiotica]|uniref:LLM class flavin-dependent oxidoreductase n=1 Tax=Kribbella antibiotica TaxID=190195 RepID=A0A4R4YG28_9ACTN|nr:LLM class flavin-dependent oxidoreductase [Kribbella antibiotica]TDD43130.1 LLM class flavin-dependent oxidoreductase [Kribbella antibiotica]
MKIGVMLPVGGSDGPTGEMPRWSDVRNVAQATEAAGLDSVWLADHFHYQAPDGVVHGMHESWTLLSAVAAVTERVEVGNMVLCASFRDPGLTAKMAAALDEVSGGRLILGVGAGWHDPEYEAFGLPTDHRVGRFEEWLEIVARLVRGETVDFKGTYYQTAEATLTPPPNRQIPILIAGARPRMLRLTAEWADAWNTAWYGAPSDKLTERLAAFRAAVDKAGRPVATTIGLSIRDPDQPSAEEDPTAFAGTVPELADLFATYRDLGADHLIVSADPMTPASVNRIAEAKALLEA